MSASVLPAACCGSGDGQTAPNPVVVPVTAYTPAGRTERLGDLDTYVAEPPSAENTKEAIVAIYDILGHGAPQNKMACDFLAKASGRVAVMPDVFRGVPFPAERFDFGGAGAHEPAVPDGVDPSDRNAMGLKNSLMAELVAYIFGGGGNYDTVVKKDLENVFAWLKKRGVEHVGIVGFCYGGYITVKASQDFAPFLCGVVGVHPALLPTPEAELVRTPLASLPSAIDDGDFTEFHAALKKNAHIPRAKTFEFDPVPLKVFTDVRHGWSTARGNFDDPLVKKRAEEALGFAAEFLGSCFRVARGE
ncbi:hypothetical protein DFJ74DRAFT_682866 [Hyaloraphidium curvatum]|nr:hypothetical protein DFJ74DRAFT_682866 [Hyaloraphidium curvatum]